MVWKVTHLECRVYWPKKFKEIVILILILFTITIVHNSHSFYYSSRDYSHRSHGNHTSGRPSSAGAASGGGNESGSSSSSRKFSRPPGDEVYVRNYRLLKTIGKGNFAKVKLARHMPTGVEVSHSFNPAVHCVSINTHYLLLYKLCLFILSIHLLIYDKHYFTTTGRL